MYTLYESTTVRLALCCYVVLVPVLVFSKARYLGTVPRYDSRAYGYRYIDSTAQHIKIVLYILYYYEYYLTPSHSQEQSKKQVLIPPH